MNHVAIFLDYENIHWTLRDLYPYSDTVKNAGSLVIGKLWEKYQSDKVRVFRVYADFERANEHPLDSRAGQLQTEFQMLRATPKHVFSSSTQANRKNAGDLEMSLDAQELIYKSPEIDTFVIVSADTDMIPLMNRLQYAGKRVDLYYLKASASSRLDITKFATTSDSLESLLGLSGASPTGTIFAPEYDALMPKVIEVVQEFSPRYAGQFMGEKLLADTLYYNKQIAGRLRISQLVDRCLKERVIAKAPHVGDKFKITIVPKAPKPEAKKETT